MHYCNNYFKKYIYFLIYCTCVRIEERKKIVIKHKKFYNIYVGIIFDD